jgi:hypothetical protein
MVIDKSTLTSNKNGKFENYPGICYQANAKPQITDSVVQ